MCKGREDSGSGPVGRRDAVIVPDDLSPLAATALTREIAIGGEL